MDEANYQPDGKRYPIAAGMRVFVYRNLNRSVAQPVFSVQSRRATAHPDFSPLPYGKVFHHATNLVLRDCSFVVGRAGHERVVCNGVKNVHAGIVGTLVAWHESDVIVGRRVSYNPFVQPVFRTDEGEVIHSSPMVWIGSVTTPKGYSSLVIAQM